LSSFLLFSKKVTKLEFEDVFCSKTRMKILKLLFKLGQLNTSDLAHRLGANYATTLRHLALLEREDVIAERLSGKTRFFRFTNSLKARTVMKLLEEWK
jgi:DNA-binding transcriptional ArsR family regulator